ncbi:hypothetical protein TRIATDRAFT_269658 [Trichoderma atroviride IMI 206040]|uniref:Cytochrome P450 n=1 Tax=Hypocrea atroviridis (strain ATCC 20476 / IMI 206040) TaxID=452589 RepID=G9NEQ0_HYPAI|nr:uncharacterized protein TRIATDRAFT_269658 [Trichoderma atroviride IMI 206040]EHK50945.1 hypothetical protein TRIATDRAFT_269658 [Trichoderma atroviride IMI 206040]
MASTIIIQALITLVSFAIYHQLFRSSKKKNLPPGPKGLSIIGNVLDLPPKGTLDHVHWKSVTDKYGPIASITILGRHLIFIADKQDAHEILEKKCSASSGRPAFEFSKYSGFGDIIPIHQQTREFKLHRKLMHKGLGTKLLVSKYADILELHTGLLLQETLKAPEQILRHLEIQANAVMLKILYGYTTSPHGDDPLVKLSDHVVANFFRTCDAFGRLVEYLPAIKWLPDGFPGTNFKAEAREHNRNAQVYVEEPYQFARRQMASRKDTKSFVAKLVKEYAAGAGEPNEADEHAIKWSAAGLQVGGSETTVTVTRTFILAAIMFPEIQRKAQEEVDRVTGGTRLPVLADQEEMPFVSAIFAEALRFFPTAPLGFPHAFDPFKFDPERFHEPRNEPSPFWSVFGFGRRICPGRHLADAALFLNIACLVAFFDFSKVVDEQGNVMEPKVELDPVRSAVAKVAPFPFKVTVRSEKHAEFLKDLEKNYPAEEGDARLLGELPLQ